MGIVKTSRTIQPNFKIGIFGQETWPLVEFSLVAHIASSTLGFKILVYFRSTADFRDSGGFCHKIATFDPAPWSLAKVPDVAHIFLSFFTAGQNNTKKSTPFQSIDKRFRDTRRPYVRSTGAVFEIWTEFGKCHIWA